MSSGESRSSVAGTLINTRRTGDGTAVVEIHGEVDISCAPELWQILVDVAETRPTQVMVELRHLTFIDSTGIGALVAGRNTARSLGIGFRVRNPSPFITTQLHQTGLYSTLVEGD
nr:STAS domain-containing protein [Planosporangium mesophilum]